LRFGLLWVGRTRDRHIRAAQEGFLERIARYVPVEVMEVKEESGADRHSESDARRREARRLKERIPPGHQVVVLDAGGREMSSEQFAEFLRARLDSSSSSTRGLTFIIGGHLGLDEEIKKIADHTISLSRMTFTHEMARLVALEQIYRGMSILRGARYHRP